MADRPDIIERGLIAALELAEDTSWSGLTLSQIATKADLTLGDFHGVASKDDLADAAESYFDKAMSSEDVPSDAVPRERLFDVIMLRFEAMEPYRAGLLSLLKFRETSPSRLAHLVGARRRSAEWALVSAGLDDETTAAKTLKILAVGYVIAMTERAWRKEDSTDFARTMSALDRELRQTEEKIDWLKRFTGRGRAEDAPQETKSETENKVETE